MSSALSQTQPLNIEIRMEKKCSNINCQERTKITNQPISLPSQDEKLHRTAGEVLSAALQSLNEVTDGDLRVTDLQLYERTSIHQSDQPVKGDLLLLLDQPFQTYQDEKWTLQRTQKNCKLCPQCTVIGRPDLLSDIRTLQLDTITPFNTFQLPSDSDVNRMNDHEQPSPLTLNPEEVPDHMAPTPPGYMSNRTITSSPTGYMEPSMSRQSSKASLYKQRPLPPTPQSEVPEIDNTSPRLYPILQRVTSSTIPSIPSTMVPTLQQTSSNPSQISTASGSSRPRATVSLSRASSISSSISGVSQSTPPTVHPPAIPSGRTRLPPIPLKTIKYCQILSDEEFQAKARAFKHDKPYIVTLLNGGNMIEVAALKKKKMTTKVVRFNIIMVRDQTKPGDYGYTIDYKFKAKDVDELLRYHQDRPVCIDNSEVKLRKLLYPHAH